MIISKKSLESIIERHIKEVGFDKNGRTIINLAGFDDVDYEGGVVGVIEGLGLRCIPFRKEDNADFMIGLPEKFIKENKKNKKKKEEKEMRKTEIYNVPIKKVEELLPEVFDYLKEMFREFVEDDTNMTTTEDYLNWRKYGYVEIVLGNGELSYTPFWPKKELPGNDLPWGYDKVEDVDADALKEISKYRIA